MIVAVALFGRRAASGCLLRHERGATLVEFGLLMPVMGLLLVGAFDLGHTLYMRSVLQGAVQKASRDSGLQSGLVSANQAALDARVRSQVQQLANHANVEIKRRSYRSFSKAAAAQAEPHTDTNKNGLCDNEEPFEDQNGNGVRDSDGGNSGQGGAKDSVLYSVTVTYARLFPVHKFIGGSGTTTVKAVTVVNNQPYGDQGVDTPKVGKCPKV